MATTADDAARVLVSTSSFAEFDPAPLERLRSEGYHVVRNTFGRTLLAGEIVELISGCCGIIAGTERLDDSIFASAPDLRVISRVGIGVDSIDLAAAAARGIHVVCTPDAPTQAVAELTVAGILSLLRAVHVMDASVRSGRWDRRTGFLLRGRTVGIIGLGRIGRSVAALLGPFGVHRIGTDIAADEDWAVSAGVELADLPTLLARSDVVTIHVPGGQGVVIGAVELDAMPQGSYLVNTARGGLVDEEALLGALESGRLAGAFLDVFSTEPYEGPLLGRENVLVTPHAGSSARESRMSMENEAVENLIATLRGAS